MTLAVSNKLQASEHNKSDIFIYFTTNHAAYIYKYRLITKKISDT